MRHEMVLGRLMASLKSPHSSLVHSLSCHQLHTHANALGLLVFPDRQALSGVMAVDTLVIDVGVLWA